MFTRHHRSSRLRKLAALLTVTAATAVVLGSSMSAAAASEDDAVTITDIVATGAEKSVDQRADPVSAEMPADEAPAVKAPVSAEMPADEAVAVEAAPVSGEMPADKAPAVEVPAIEIPAVEVPAIEIPAVEVPAVEVPAVEVPAVVETPVAEGMLVGVDPLSNDQLPKQDGGAVFTTDVKSEAVNGNIYMSNDAVYLNGGPDQRGDRFPDGTYFVKVTEPNGTVLGSGSVTITGGNFRYQLSSILRKASNNEPGYDKTTNHGGEYKVWVSTDPDFANSASKTDNFKVRAPETPPTPEEPTTPEKPATPEKPTSPETPATPRTPATPDETPATPEQPTTEELRVGGESGSIEVESVTITTAPETTTDETAPRSTSTAPGVVVAEGDLPETGSPTRLLISIGAILSAAGAAFVRIGRTKDGSIRT